MLYNDDLLPSQFVQWSDETVLKLTRLRLTREYFERMRFAHSQLVDERDALLIQIDLALNASPNRSTVE